MEIHVTHTWLNNDKELVTSKDVMTVERYEIHPSGALILSFEPDGHVWTIAPGSWISITHAKPEVKPSKIHNPAKRIR